MNRLTARDLLDLVIDAGTWESWDTPPIPVATDSDYAEALLRAQEKTGLDESVLTGSASVRGRRVAIIVCEFGFLGGSIGVAAGERLVVAIRRATQEQLPLLALPTSGGTRMQEGTTAFFCRWSRSPRRSSSTKKRTCPTSSISETPPPEAYSRPGDHSVT